MVCKSCGEKPENTAKDFTKAVVEINNPDKLVLFRKVVVPVSMGTEEDFPASVGKYYNVLLQYEANGDMYLYSSDGIPTKLSSDVSELQHELDQLGIKVDGEILARIAADSALEDSITALDDSLSTVAKTGDYNDLTNKPTIGNATLTIKRNNANVGTFTANATANKSIDISVPTKTSDIANDGSDGSSTYVESDELSAVATSGSYNDLLNKPTIGNATLTIKKNNANVGTFTANATSNKSINIAVPTKTSELTNNGSDNTSVYVEADELATVATTGNYNDLTNKPTIGNATLTIKRNSTQLGTFKANATSGTTVDISVPTKTSDLTNDGADGTSTFVETDDLPVVDTAYSASSNNAIANSTVTNSLNRDVMTNLTLDTSPSTTTVNLNNTKTNLASPSSTTTTAITLPVASSTQAGVMNSSTFDAVTNNTNNINALLSGAVAVTGLPASPTQAQITSAWQSETGLSSLINRASVYDVTNNKVWTYYTNDTTWHAASNTSQVTVNTFTNSSEGVIKGSTNAGQVFAENDGTGSVNGWDTLTGTVANHTSKLATIEQGAEVNVQSNWTQTNTTADDYIKNKPANLVQDANYVHTDNNFTTTLKNKLNGIESGAEVNVQADWSQSNTSADDYIKNKPTIPTVNNATLTIQKNGTNVQTFTANSSTNKTANITVPTAVSELTNDANYATTTQLSDGLATKQNTLTAGSNITIANNTISATDTTYTAGNAIDITNNVISADVHPADFFTSTTETVTAEGTDLTMQGTALAPFVDVTPKGDTFQQTYTGKNLAKATNVNLTDSSYTLTISNSHIYINSKSADNSFDLCGGLRNGKWLPTYENANDYHLTSADGGTYTLSAPNFRQSGISANWTISVFTNQRAINNTFKTGTDFSSATITLRTDEYIKSVYVWTGGGSENGTVQFDLQLEAGSTATAFEPYVGGTASPNPDYPQDVKVVTGEQTVKVTGKNLFDINNRNGIPGYFDGSQAVSTIMIGTAGRNRIIYIPCEPSTTYSFSFADLTDMNSPQVGTTTETPDSGVTVNRLGNISSSTLKLEGSTTPSDAKYIVVRFQTKNSSVDLSTALENCLSKFQIEQSQTATDYEAYQSQEYELNLFENLYDKDSAFRIDDDIRLDISVQPNTTYIFKTGKAWTGAFLYDSNDTQTRTVGHDASGTHSVEFTTAANEVKARLTFYGGPSFDIETYDFSHIFFYVKNSIELCKIGNYQDYIYKSGGNWYKHEEVEKITLDGTENYDSILANPTSTDYYYVASNYFNSYPGHNGYSTLMSDRFQNYGNWFIYSTSVTKEVFCFTTSGDLRLRFMIKKSRLSEMSTSAVKTWFSNNPTNIYYVRSSATDTQITDADLIAQLEALANANSYVGVTHMAVTSDGYNLPFILTAEAFANTLVGMTEVIDGKQRRLTAGENIAIDANNVISATDTTYTAGNAIDIDENNVISADVYPADFFTNATETITAEGTGITMQGTVLAPFESITPKGDTSQQTYTGKNLLQNTATTTSTNGITFTVNTDGSVTANGTATAAAWLQIHTNLTTDGDCSMSGCPAGGGSATYSIQTSSSPTVSADYGSGTTFNKTQAYNVFIVIRSGVTANNLTFYPQIEAGSSATSFEPYVGGTASPNPDYPQDVKVVTGEQTVTVTGKNLANYVPKTSAAQGLSSTYDSTTGEIHITGTATSAGWSDISQTVQEVLPAGTYTFSVINVSGNFDRYVNFQIVGGNSHYCGVNSTKTFTTTADSSKIRFWLSTTSGKVYDATIKIQLELGSTATAYEPYQGQEYQINLGKNLLDIATLVDGYVTSNGTFETVHTQAEMRSGFIKVIPNTTYTFSIIETTSTYPSWFGVGEYSSSEVSSFIRRDTNTTATDTSITFTTSATTQYIVVSARNMAGATKVQVELGPSSTSYAPYFTPIELCKIGDYQDYFYKDGGNWYLHKEVKKITLDGTENWSSRTNNSGTLQMDVVATTDTPVGLNTASQYCNYARYRASAWNFGEVGEFAILDNTRHLLIGVPSTTTIEAWKAKIGANNLIAYFVLATPTNTQITNTALIEQLGALSNANSYRDVTYIKTASDGYNLPAIITVEMFTNSLAGISKAIDGKQGKLTAGENITIDANNVISATATGNSTITMTDTDPGEGQPLAADNYIAVYGGSGRGGFSRYTANQSIPGSTATTLLPNTTQTPDDGISYANGVAVIQKAGWWILTATVGGTQTAAGYLTVEIAVNNVVVSSASGATTANFTHCRNVIWAGKLSVGDTVKVQVSTQFAMNINKRERGVFCGVLVSED